MTDEIKIEEKHTCICQSNGLRKFLTIAGGTFVGAFLALSLFGALNKPPVIIPIGTAQPCPCCCHHMMPPMHGHHYGKKFHGDKAEYYHKFKKEFNDKQVPARGERPAPILED